MQDSKERTLLVGIQQKGRSRQEALASLRELERLVETAGGEVVGSTFQEVKDPNPKTFIGKGKVLEIQNQISTLSVQMVVIDNELSSAQNRNLEEILNIKVLDRTAVILDIFAKRAHTKEGRLQVELAQLEYIQSRLRGMWTHLGQQAGGIGMRGPGETQLEVDRRRLKEKITRIQKQLEEVKIHRTVNRHKQQAVSLQMVSLVGYTNAGKSTLFNNITHAHVLVEDKLFATLDPTVRRVRLPSGREILFADTVGFIRQLPHGLVEAFKATFEEMAHAHLLIHLVDGSDPEVFQQIKVVEGVLAELGVDHKPLLTVFNKMDLPHEHSGELKISALTGEGVGELLDQIDLTLRDNFKKTTLILPHHRGDVLSQIYTLGHVEEVRYVEEGVVVSCELYEKYFNKFKEFQMKPNVDKR